MAVIDNSPSLPIPELTRYRREVPFHRGIEELANDIDFEAFRPKLEELCHYGSKGRPHYDEVLMFQGLILQTLYDLSDEAMEYSFSRFRIFWRKRVAPYKKMLEPSHREKALPHRAHIRRHQTIHRRHIPRRGPTAVQNSPESRVPSLQHQTLLFLKKDRTTVH